MNQEGDFYLSIDKVSEGFLKEKGSKFLAFALPCSTKSEAKSYLDDFRKNHPNACHVCFAWRFGYDIFEDRYSDDGEPNNSAGKPIFGQIIAANLTNVLIAVVRYYGGTNLGVGGLISAYKTAAKEAISNASIVEKEITIDFEITYQYDDTGSVMLHLNKLQANITGQSYENNKPKIEFKLKRSFKSELFNAFEQYKEIHLKEKE